MTEAQQKQKVATTKGDAMMMKKSVDSIVGGIRKVVNQLNALAEQKATEVVEISDKVVVMEQSAEEARTERDRASRIARKLEEILD